MAPTFDSKVSIVATVYKNGWLACIAQELKIPVCPQICICADELEKAKQKPVLSKPKENDYEDLFPS